ncbi:MAG TPA: 7TM diverse intracellular signaling domain-containing protein [Oligoflexus sp.]|uniref:7TM diverse intracellular signaling domain-containing protein n=1 Tax=Oligoflexus sp. TaxID=1971216 RepID=UPI002D7FB655|nr:7TM diverse intracellular signaling domain-containing protein [Oligoflexus sp.]HET9236646.1 7TM diverse intracellular signaling domain-containing protein [Oligoflexus sp.]
MLRKFCKILLTLLLLSPATPALSQQVRNGLLDLRDWDFEKEALVPLRGSWEFYWSHLYTPTDFQGRIPEGQEWIKVPGSWSLVTKYPTFGFATYRLRVILKEPRTLALHSPWILSSAKIFIDGVMIEELGRVGQKRERDTGQTLVRDDIWTFTPRSAAFDIVIQAANHESMMSGFPHAPTLGTARAIKTSYQRELSLALALIGSFLLMGVYHLCLYALRRSIRSTLYFGLVCLAIGLYVFGAEGTVVATFLPDIEYPLRLRLILSWMLATPAFLYYARELFPSYFPRTLAQAYTVFSLGLFIYFWLADITAVSAAFYVYQAVTALLIFYSLWALMKALRRREEGAGIFIMGLTVIGITGIHDLLRAVIDSRPLSGFGLLAFIIGQSFLLARRFSNAFTDLAHSEMQVRQLNENLEQLVEEKTRDIRSIMDHIQLGIFAITSPGRSIHKDYSRYLETIFKKKDFIGTDATELLFQNSHLNSDERHQVAQALDAMLGETALSFELNSAALPHETRYGESEGHTRILDLSWHPVVNAHDIIEKILVATRDVTHLRMLEHDAQDRQEELQFIQELLNVAPEAFQRFIQNCQEYLEENHKLINSRSIALRDMQALKVLFINMHTMKGAARSLYLKKITRIFHDVEQYYVRLQKEADAHWDVERMNQDLEEAHRVLATYESINNNKLGRRWMNTDRIVVAASDLLHMYKELKALSQEQPPTASERIARLQSHLLPLVYRPLQETLEDVLSCTQMLARDLHKLPPNLTIEAHGFYMEQQTDQLLRRVLVHIVRNSMDHGIEDPQKRAQQGKSEAGHIRVHVIEEAGWVVLRYQDDGQGLNLKKLADLAQHQGLIRDGEDLTLEAKARLIFRSGLSTAKVVSDISGRGMGMEAVKTYLEGAGGEIQIQLLNPESKVECHPFCLEIRLPLTSFIQASLPITPAAA